MGIDNLQEVYILHHGRDLEDGHEDIKILGIFSSESKASELVKKYKKMPGFKDSPDGFSINKYIIDKSEWTEGFTTLNEFPS